MADNFLLPAIGDSVRATENAGGSKTQHILPGNFKSTDNTSVTPLTGAATFTGAWEVSPADGVTVSCLTDAAGTLFFDFSNDAGVTSTTFPTNGFSVAANIHEFHRAAVNGRSFRVRLINGAAAQSSLALYTYYGPHTHPSAPLNQTLGADADAQVVRSTDPGVDLALGKLGGVIEDTKFGILKLADIADTPEDIWDFASDDINTGPTLKTFPTSSGDFFISSDSASDADVDLTVEYIDENGAAQIGTAKTNGQTPTDLGFNGFDINRAYVSGATAAVGNIYFTTANNHTGGVPNDNSQVLAFIRASDGQTQQALYTVPLDRQMQIKFIVANMVRASGAAGSAEVTLRVREFGGTWLVKRHLLPSSSVGIFKTMAGLVIPARSSVAMRAVAISDNETSIVGEMYYNLIS